MPSKKIDVEAAMRDGHGAPVEKTVVRSYLRRAASVYSPFSARSIIASLSQP